jgi:hypothetical protein
MSILICGCGLQSQKTVNLVPTREIGGKGEILSTPSQIRIVSLKNENASYIFCSEPTPDSTLSDTFKMVTEATSDTTSGLAAGTQSVNASEKLNLKNDLQTSTTALELAGRTQTVLLAREFLYRTCEAAANGWLGPTEVKDAHNKVIEQITGLIKTDQKKAETTAAVAAIVATGKLDPKLLSNASTAVSDAIKDSCITNFQRCSSSAATATEYNKCKSDFKDCLP